MAALCDAPLRMNGLLASAVFWVCAAICFGLECALSGAQSKTALLAEAIQMAFVAFNLERRRRWCRLLKDGQQCEPCAACLMLLQQANNISSESHHSDRELKAVCAWMGLFFLPGQNSRSQDPSLDGAGVGYQSPLTVMVATPCYRAPEVVDTSLA